MAWIRNPGSNHLYSFWLILDLDIGTLECKCSGEDMIYYSQPTSAPTALHFMAYLVKADVGHHLKMK